MNFLAEAQSLWENKGWDETLELSKHPSFQEFWDEDWKNLTEAMRKMVLNYYIIKGWIPQ